jgi:hypothetical protein
MMKFFRRFKDLGLEGGQAKLYDKNTREYRDRGNEGGGKRGSRAY